MSIFAFQVTHIFLLCSNVLCYFVLNKKGGTTLIWFIQTQPVNGFSVFCLAWLHEFMYVRETQLRCKNTPKMTIDLYHAMLKQKILHG